MTRIFSVASATIGVLCMGLASIASAQQPPEPRPDGRRGPPPQAFIEACSGKSEGDTVSLTLPGRDGATREVSAKCQLHEGVLSARPERPAGTDGQRPPPPPTGT